MVASRVPRLTDIIQAIERIRSVGSGSTLESFERDWQKQWLVERGVQVISEASRHLPEDLKSRHPDISWQKVASIGNVLRHDYGRVAAPMMWKLATEDLRPLEMACRAELAAAPR